MKLVHGLHQESPRVVEVEVGLHHGYVRVVELVMELHYGSSTVVKLEFGLHQRCYIREHEVSRGGKASNGASPPKMQKVKFMMELHHGSSKEHEASVGASS